MKTFSEFIAEAKKTGWNTGILKGSGKSPSDTANQKLRQVSSSMAKAHPSQMVAIAQRIKRMKDAISTSTEKATVDDPRPETKDTKTRRLRTQRINTGYASKPADTRARGGSLPNISSPDGEGSGSRVTGRYGDLRTGRSGGVRSTMKHKGTSGSGEKFGRLGRA
jgi:hypothetical protein